MRVNEIILESKEKKCRQAGRTFFCSTTSCEFYTHVERIRDCSGQHSSFTVREYEARTRAKLFYRSVSMADPTRHGESRCRRVSIPITPSPSPLPRGATLRRSRYAIRRLSLRRCRDTGISRAWEGSAPRIKSRRLADNPVVNGMMTYNLRCFRL